MYAKRFDGLASETKDFLNGLSEEDVTTLQNGLPIIRAIIDFGKVTKWLTIAVICVVGGVLMLGEPLMEIAAWFRP